MRGKYIAGMDLVRFSAATMVMFSHLFYSTWFSPTIAQQGSVQQPIWAFPAFGWVGVQIFFVLSGYVIAYTADGASAFKFAASRIIRLAPSAWICSTITLVILLFGSDLAPVDVLVRWLKALTFFPKPPFIDNVYWTLGLEIFFYGLIFLLLCSNQFKRVEWLAIALIAITTVFWAAYFLTKAPVLEVIRGSRDFTILLVRHGSFFGLGILLWLCTNRVTWPRVFLIAVCVLTGILQIIDEHGSQTGAAGVAPPGLNATPFLAAGVWVFALVLMVLAIRYNDRLPQAPWMRTVGLMTYPLYLIHNVAGSALIQWISPSLISPVWAVVVAMLLSIATAWIVTTTLERYLQNVLKSALDEAPFKRRFALPFLYRPTTSPLLA